jgi:dTDP-4-dehydrorhamnose 3,5-epimerase
MLPAAGSLDTSLTGPRLVGGPRHPDDRGWFEEMWSEARFAAQGVSDRWVQSNRSWSARAGTVRGLHWQTAPSAQAKFVTVLSGAILDVVVDIRRSSPDFGLARPFRLDSASCGGLYVPVGFAHGFCTLEPETAVAYLVSAPWNGACERSLLWNDPALSITWPVAPSDAILSDKDRAAPVLAALAAGDLFD